MYPSIRYSGRLQADTADTLRPEVSMFEGPAPAPVATGTAGDPRWGDYTVLSVDPTDDCTFWYVNEYMDPNKIPEDTVAALSRWWHTRIGFFMFENCASPTAVLVKSFAARWRGKQVSVTWRTSSEADVAGFNLYRSVGAGPFRKVSRTLLAAKQTGRVRGAAYSLVDRAVKRSKTYTFRLQIVAKNGKRSWYGVGCAASR